MKVQFTGIVTPEIYATGEWYVEGVGDKIVLIKEDDLYIPTAYNQEISVPFDSERFDRLPWENASGYAGIKDYIVSNRASNDKNYWSRSNKWFHKNVIEQSAAANGQPSVINESLKAKKPIIEFEASLKLSNFGTITKKDVDLIDNITTDVFSTIEGKAGYNVDGIDLVDGMRVLFLADTDVLVKNKIYEVKFIQFVNSYQLTLQPTDDTNPALNEIVLAKNGTTNKGIMFHYDGSTWIKSQYKSAINQSPIFELFDQTGDSLYNFDSVSQSGTKILSYKQSTSSVADPELGFGISYRTIENIGDILFDFNLLTDVVTYQVTNQTVSVDSDQLLIRKYSNKDSFTYVNAWATAPKLSKQPVIRQTVADRQQVEFAIDVYNNSASLPDLWIRVYKNDKLLINTIDYNIINIDSIATIQMVTPTNEGDDIVIKTHSAAPKNNNGYYELPLNLQNNPNNENITGFTFGEFTDHVSTIVEELENINGQYPGASDLRDFGKIAKFGTKFVKHSAPLNLANFHLNDENANIIKAIEFNKREYGKFKREFLDVANTLGYDGNVKDHVDLVLRKITNQRNSSMPFYFSDMVGFANGKTIEHKVFDTNNRFYPLTKVFNLDALSIRSVNVYHNDKQLAFRRDYTFNSEGFVVLENSYEVAYNDIISICEYENTDGCYIPPTPTKIGLYPSYVPEIYVDNTYREPTTVVQGHDGSIRVAYNDFRDDLLLELEMRIYNNIKVAYDETIFNIHDYIGGEFRTTKFSQQQIDNVYIDDFINWLDFVGNPDYTEYSSFFSSADPFTFNYYASNSPSLKSLNGFWRGIYKDAYDTDRPHSHPWEILGFTIEPNWWTEVYGPRPYTGNNLPMWKDLEAGIVREPGKPVEYRLKYARPGLASFPPADEQGRIQNPLNSGYIRNYSNALIKSRFKFGDYAPAESAWRKSSDYPFALIKSLVVNRPAHIFGIGFDRSRVSRNFAGQLVYGNTNTAITTSKLVFPNSLNSSARIQTAGLVNFVANLIHNDVNTSYSQYQTAIKSINNKLGLRVGGFTNKDKFNLLLDSRSPYNQDNVFVPAENYNLFLNKSTAFEVVTYSGVIIEKLATGFVIRGYDKFNPVFKIYSPIKSSSDTTIREGGTSENYVDWDTEKTYVSGNLVRYEGRFYRVLTDHTSGTTFDATLFVSIKEVPVVGGVSASISRQFNNYISYVDYGTTYTTIQEVIDFIAGYEKYLTTSGFIFESFSPEVETVQNWRMSMKDFLFWTTQNWQENSVITLSPAAETIKFYKEDYIVDNIFNELYAAIPLNSNGKPINPANLTYSRINKEFILQPKNTLEGIYFAKLPITQKEHIILLDNETIFKDVIYNKAQGYRQERIKVLGYRSSNWDGSINIPGFILEDITIHDWKENTDYSIGDIVKYKRDYYVALENVPGTLTLSLSNWARLEDKPESGLYPNFEYKINQFADFYDLDTDNFDVEQQTFAQHLIGYQKRKYLQNIIKDDVSQYKFYQGFIQEKGTKNALTKLFDALSSAGENSLEFYEEWALRVGSYGAIDGITELEYILDESKFNLSPQPIEISSVAPVDSLDLIYRQPITDVYLTAEGYNPLNAFPTQQTINEVIPTAGYVHSEDVDYEVATYTSILNLDATQLLNGQYVWVGNRNGDWDVLKFVNTDLVPTIVDSGVDSKLIFNNAHNLTVGEIFVISTETSGSEILRAVKKIENNAVIVNKITITETVMPIRIFVSKRFADLEAFSSSITLSTVNDKIWVDSTDKNWGAYQRKEDNFSKVYDNTGTANWLSDFDVNRRNNILTVGYSAEGKVEVYARGTESIGYTLEGEILQDNNLADNQGFGKSVAISQDGKYIAVGSPTATNIKTNIISAPWNETTAYDAGNIVLHNNSYWTATQEILPAIDNQNYETFVAYPLVKDNLSDSTAGNFLVAGNYPATNTIANHFLIRATTEQYLGVPIGSVLELVWNRYSVSNINPLLQTQPFENTVFGLDYNWLTGSHPIVDRVDIIITVNLALNQPAIGDLLQTGTGVGTINYLYPRGNGYVIYLKNIAGNFSSTGTVTTATGVVIGDYNYEIPSDSHNELGGYWMISTDSIAPSGVEFRDVIVDNTPSLIIADIVDPSDIGRTTDEFYSIGEDIATTGTIQSGNDKVSLIGRFESPAPEYPIGYDVGHLWFVRLGNTAPSFTLSDIIKLQENTFLQNINWQEFGLVGLTNESIFSNSHTIGYNNNGVGFLDGYIKVQLQADQVGLHNFVRGDILEDVNTGALIEIWHASIDAGLQTQTLYVNFAGNTPTYNLSLGSTYSNSTRIIRRRAGEVNRDAGFMIESSVYTATNNIGKLIILNSEEHTTLGFDLPPITGNQYTSMLENYEYWVVPQVKIQAGEGRLPNVPTPNNSNWLFTNSIPVVSGTETNFTNTGFVSVYERLEPGVYVPVSKFVIPGGFDNVGKTLEFRNINELYVLYIGADDKIIFVKNGIENNTTYNWEISLDKDFRNEFSSLANYYVGDIVIYNNILYQAMTNIAATEWNASNWQPVDNDIDYTGYVPKTIVAGTDIKLLDGFDAFGEKYSISDDGTVLAVYVTRDNPSVNIKVNDEIAVYRYINNSYRLSNIISIDDTSVNDLEYTHSFAMDAAGTHIAIGSYKEDTTNGYDSGFVKLYKYNNLSWTVVDTIYSPEKDNGENFGYNVEFVGTSLIVSSLFGDTVTERTFTDGTTFDNGFTNFVETEYNVGSVYVFDNINGVYVYSNKIDASVDITKGLMSNGLHLYGTNIGTSATLIDYRFTGNPTWTKFREQLPVVDINKFKGTFIYNKASNEFISYIDIIDPIQGKIAGPAEQELRYKSSWDPAIFTNVSEGDTVNVDKFKSWGKEQVGQLWWDISTARFKNPYQGDAVYQTNTWNTLFKGSTIDVYEWVESDYSPSTWNEITDTEEGLSEGISGQVKYNTDTYVLKKKYDSITQSFNNKYYFWVKNKKTIPNVNERLTSCYDVAQYIQDPRTVGYKYAELQTSNRYVINNILNDIKGRDTVVNFTWWTIPNQELNIHNQYQLISDGLYTSKPNQDLVNKWIDSLVGFDKNLKEVPDPTLSPKLKYGTLSRPRQSWFINRLEALKTVVERANLALRKIVVVDEFDLSDFYKKDDAPLIGSRLYDYLVDSDIDLQFIGTSKYAKAILTPVFENGRLISVTITNPGKGYIDLSYEDGVSTVRNGPKINVIGNGSGAEVECTIDANGSINSVTILNSGSGYNQNSSLEVRALTALINSDATIGNKWSMAEYNPTLKVWQRTVTQNYDVTLYWSYVDWYATGYNQFTDTNYIIDYAYQLEQLDDRIGDVVKINNVGTGGWLLLKKIDDAVAVDYSVNYETVGRENGTIEITKGLYDFEGTISGYDGYSYDITIYDGVPVTEARIILNSLFDKIFVDNLEIEYNKIFMASLRYVLSEGQKPDWLFKTSFVKAKYNFGELEQKTHYQNDNLTSYQDYIDEVKPYKTTIREYISSYNKVDQSSSQISDFDLMPWYSPSKGKIYPKNTRVENGSIVLEGADEYPWKSWFDNATYYVEKIQLSNAGSNFTLPPVITLEGGGGTGATAVAYISRGKITSIDVVTPGQGYTSAPTVVINGSQTDGGIAASATAIINNDTVRKIKTTLKFDRTSGEIVYLDLNKEQSFVSTSNQQTFKLTWPLDLRHNLIYVTVDGEEALRSEYTFGNAIDSSASHTVYRGYIQFTDPLIQNKTVVITYNVDPAMLSAADRIHSLYKPMSGMPGYSQLVKDLSQVLDGIDYGGVEITSFDFDTEAGWDSNEWYTTTWDTFGGTYEDEIFTITSGQLEVVLAAPLELGIVYTLYVNDVRIDDPNYDAGTPTNSNAITNSITGNGVTSIIDISTFGLVEGNKLIVRKMTSDGTFLPDGASYDTQLSGGTFAYGNAKGIAAGEIIIDGDGFVTPTTSRSTDEHVPGQVLDTIDIKVYDRTGSGQGVVVTRTHWFNADVEYAVVALKEQQLEILQQDYTAGAATLASLQSQLDALNAELVTLQSALSDAEALRDANNLLQPTYLNLLSEKIAIENNISSKTSQLSALQNALTPLESQKIQLEFQIPTLTSQISSLENQIDVLNSDITSLGADLQNYLPGTTQYNQIVSLINQKAAQRVALISQLSTLQSQLPNLQSQLISVIAQINSIQDDILVLNSELIILQNDLIIVNSDIQTYEFNYTQYVSAVTDAQNNVTNKETSILSKQSQVNNQSTVAANLAAAANAKAIELAQAQEALNALLVPLDIGLTPLKEENLIVRISNSNNANTILTKSEYTIDYTNKTVTLKNAPESRTTITTLVVGVNGTDIISSGTFIGDGSTTQFLTSLTYQEGLTSIITVDGEKRSTIVSSGEVADAVLLQSTSEYEIENAVILEFGEAPKVNSLINYAIYSNETQTFSEITIDELETDGSTTTFALSQQPFNKLPADVHTLVIADGALLDTGYNTRVTATIDTFYPMNQESIPYFSKAVEQIEVYINGVLQTHTVSYRWYTENSTLELFTGYFEIGDTIELYTRNENYRITNSTLELLNLVPTSTLIVYQFSNHDVLDIRRSTTESLKRNSLIVGSEDWKTYAESSLGIIPLSSSVINEGYVWIALNGELLSPTVDYGLLPDYTSVKIYRDIPDGAKLDVIHFSGAVSTNRFGYRQFKDILNRTHYKRINSVSETKLSQNLSITDLRIYVEDGSKLDTPNKSLNLPGIIFVNGERIEYFVKEENTLRQIHRGTLGTGVNSLVKAGTTVSSQGAGETIPYRDQTLVTNLIGDGISNEFELDFSAQYGVNQFEVFVEGKRLRKTEIQKFNASIDQTSPAGDETLPAEFSVYGIDDNMLRLLNVPNAGAQIKVVRKVGTQWRQEGVSLKDSKTKIGSFLRNGIAGLPE
jgi:hypothetical protein